MYKIASILSLALVSAAASAAPATAPANSASAPRQMADASPSAPAAASTATTTAAPVDKKICKQLPSSYSHSTQRVCLTKDEWKQVDEQMQN